MLCCTQLLQWCLTLCNPVDCNLPGSSVHEILQARILEWVAMPFSRESSQPRGSNPGLPHCGQILYYLSHEGSPYLWFSRSPRGTGHSLFPSWWLWYKQSKIRLSVPDLPQFFVFPSVPLFSYQQSGDDRRIYLIGWFVGSQVIPQRGQ